MTNPKKLLCLFIFIREKANYCSGGKKSEYIGYKQFLAKNMNLIDNKLLICRIIDNFCRKSKKKVNNMRKNYFENKYFLQSSKKSYNLEMQTNTFFLKNSWG